MEGLGARHELGLILEEREHGDLHRRDARAQAQHGALLDVALVVPHVLLGVAGAQQGEEDPVDADRGLDDVGHEPLL